MLDVARMVEAVLDAMDAPIRRLAERIAALETRPPPERGEKGETGTPGAKGDKGDPGEIGRDGRDGAPGRDGKDGERGEAGSNGTDGRDGIDGLGFDDLAVDYDGARSFVFRFSKGERVREFPFALPVMIYREAWDPALAYEPGDMVTAGGSMWHCNAPTRERPDDGVTAWTRAVRRGRDGRNGKDGDKGEKGETGATGRAGRDLTQMAPDGSKW